MLKQHEMLPFFLFFFPLLLCGLFVVCNFVGILSVSGFVSERFLFYVV